MTKVILSPKQLARCYANLQVNARRALLELDLTAVALANTLSDLALALHRVQLRHLGLQDAKVVRLELLTRRLTHAQLEQHLLALRHFFQKRLVRQFLEILNARRLEASELISRRRVAFGANDDRGALLRARVSGGKLHIDTNTRKTRSVHAHTHTPHYSTIPHASRSSNSTPFARASLSPRAFSGFQPL